MKKLLITGALLIACLLTALAVGGDAGDPLVSLSYLMNTFSPKVETAVGEKLHTTGGGLAETTEYRLKSGDRLTGGTGLSCTLLAGGARVDFSGGAVVDMTDGKELPSGAPLQLRHRYLVAEDTTASFVVTASTAVLQAVGRASLAPSDTVDYYAAATALQQLGLFRGTGVGYGGGFDLHLAPTRVQALIMFIRVLGEEDAALAYTGGTPFRDIKKGSLSEHYVGYAFAKGYSNGCTKTEFLPDLPVTATQYTEFLLRALGYSKPGGGDLTGTLQKAVASGVLTPGEQALLEREPYLRAQLAYQSYYALAATLADGSGTLQQKLIADGIFTAETAAAATIQTPRLP
ncbi:MAG: S-layer homology domain-containing protein [Oscillospiraceae bacterium]